MGSLKPHILKWWDIANGRRFKLIKEKHEGKGLTPIQEKELEMLQKVAGAIMSFDASPFKPIPPAIQELMNKMDEEGCTGMGDPKPESTELT